jgi:predicted membrane protein
MSRLSMVWLMFLVMRLSPFDIRKMPGIGIAMLIALTVAVLAPMLAAALAGAALVRQPKVRLNLLTLGGAIAALLGQMFLFQISKWL